MSFLKKPFLVLLFLVPVTLYGQRNVYVNLDVDQDSQGNIVFYAQNSSQKKFHITIEFTKLMNLRCDCGTIFEGNIGQGRTKLVKLIQDSKIGGIDYDYQWGFREGWANPKIKEGVIYMMPIASGNATTIIGMKNIEETYGDEEEIPNNFYAIGFKMNKGDTVFATRRGVVERVFDGREPEGENLTFSKNVNRIVVRHKDNTEGTYSVLKNRSFFVEEGQAIEAGQPLAIVGGENYGSGPHVRFRVSYLKYDKRELTNRYSWAYLKPKFTTEHYNNILLEGNSDYTSLHTTNLIYQEWTKRELKKMRKKKK